MFDIEGNRAAAHQRQPIVGDDEQRRQISIATGDQNLAFPEDSFALKLTPGAAARAAYDRQIV